MSANVGAALAYARRGWPVLPVRRGGKAPTTLRGHLDATCDETTVTAWWTRHPSRNVGIRTGAPSALVVLDVDGDEGAASLRRLQADHRPLPATRTVRTPSGGSHLYFAHPGVPVPCSAGRLGAKLDVRGDGGYVVAPPSRSAEHGRSYVVETDAPVADLPAWLFVLMTPDAPAAQPAPTPVHDVDPALVTPEGEGEGEGPHKGEGRTERENRGNYLDRLIRAHEDGRLDPEPIAGMPPLHPRARHRQREAHALLTLLFGIRMADGVDDPLPLAGSVVADRLGLADERSGRRLLDTLAEAGVVWNHGRLDPAPGRLDGTKTWLPGPRPIGPEPEHGWRVESAADELELEPSALPPARPSSTVRPTPDVLIRRAVERAPVGSRNAAGAWLAQQMRDNGVPVAEAVAAMRTYANAVPPGAEPYTVAEARRTLRSAYRRPPREPWGGRARVPT